MKNGDRLSAISDEKANVLDITGILERGDALKQEIVSAVKDTQSVLLTKLPNILLMRPDQFEDLNGGDEMAQMYQSQQRMYVTPQNAMEVVIKEL